MERTQEASGGGQAEADHAEEPWESQDSGLEQLLVPAEKPQPESSESSSRAGPEAAGAGQDHSEKKVPPPSRPGPQRGPPLSLGYGAFRRLGSTSREPPSPGPASAEEPRDGESPGTELVPWTASVESTPGTWTPMELQVDVRVKPVGAAGGSRTPSPAPSTRFITVPVPESPAVSRNLSAAHPLLQRTPSSGSTWGRGSPLAAARSERGCHAEGWNGQADGRASSLGSPTCRCQEPGLPKEDDSNLDDKKLPRVIALIDGGDHWDDPKGTIVLRSDGGVFSTETSLSHLPRLRVHCRRGGEKKECRSQRKGRTA